MTFDGFERDPGIEVSAIVVALLFHPIPLGVSSHFTTLRAGPNFGVHHTLKAEGNLRRRRRIGKGEGAVAKDDAVAQARFISRLFGLAA